jgi:hypothetical protein
MADESVVAATEADEAKVDKPKTLLDLIIEQGGPAPTEIDALKAKHGDVFVTAFTTEEVFIFRSVKRGEYRQLQLDMANPELKLDQYDFEDRLCQLCVLWPKNSSALQKAGTATSLSEQIMQNSNFLNPQQAAAIVMKL